MKMVSAVGAVLLVAMAVGPAMAEDGKVSRTMLKSLGLGGLQEMSDADGLAVRGSSSSAFSSSFSMFSLFLFDPNTGFNAAFTGADFGRTTDENAGLAAPSSATTTSAASNGPIAATITFDGVTWTATVGPIAIGGMGIASSP